MIKNTQIKKQKSVKLMFTKLKKKISVSRLYKAIITHIYFK